MIKKQTLQISISLLLLFLIENASGQQLHRQMLSSQGSTITLKSGIMVLQTIGQQSLTGNASVSNLTLQQGFQQSLLAKFSPTYNINTIATTIYPNPFRDNMNINFSQSIAGEMTIALYNMFGVMIYKEQKQNPALTLTFNFNDLPTGSYVLQLTADNYAFSKTLIKQ